MELCYVSFLLIGLTPFFTHAMHGGVPYAIEKVPYMAQTYDKYKDGRRAQCGAAILSDLWILTAAHCIKKDDPKLAYTQVRIGTNRTRSQGKLHNISRSIIHPEYSVETRWKYDISLIELAEPIEFNNKSQTIPISKKRPPVGQEITITGYGDDGAESGYQLKMGQQTIITQRECREAYKNTPQGKFMIDDRVFCVKSDEVDAGSGDSGSPGVLNGEVVGVAVEGAEGPLPNVYVNVANYYSWIADTTGINFD